MKKERWMGIESFFAEIEGNRRVVLSGCRGISAYTEECVALRAPFGFVTLYGQNLTMGCMTAEGATVTGKIQRIELSEEV